MQLPLSLQSAIEEIVETLDLRSLSQAREELTRHYKRPAGSSYMETDAQRLAYIFSRLPATYAANRAVLEAIKERGDWQIKSALDLGAGPGTALWALCEIFSSIEKGTLIEKDSSLAAIGKQLSQRSPHPALHSADWREVDLEELDRLPPHDLVILSYSIGELQPSEMIPILELCWQAAQQLLIIVEPGTPLGFERIRSIRRQLMAWGGHLVAPCPHHVACPMAGGDWCHFAARVERTSLHRKLKGGSLGHEDEKFSYVAAAKFPVVLPDSRILSPPERHSGHVILKLCTDRGVQTPTISKKMGPLYKQARKADWGDPFSIRL